MINPPEIPIDEARNEAHVASMGVWLYRHKKRNVN